MGGGWALPGRVFFFFFFFFFFFLRNCVVNCLDGRMG
jgi:hypothetical protein